MTTLAYAKNSLDKTIKKYEMLLEFVNALLVNMGKQSINDLSEFKFIQRNELLTESNEKLIDNYSEKLHEYFSKYNTKYEKRKVLKRYLLIFLQALFKELDLEFKSQSLVERHGKTFKSSVIYSVIIPTNEIQM